MRLAPIPAARLSLVASTALSATYPTSLKLLYAAEGAPLSPSIILTVRFIMMAAIAQLVLQSTEDLRTQSSGFVGAAAELGFWAWAGALCNTAGLQQSSAVHGILLLSTINILTPTLTRVIGTSEARRALDSRTWIACIIALVSTVLALSGEATAAAATSPITALSLSHGDELILCAACCYATQQVRLGSLVAKYPPQPLAAARLQAQAVCSIACLGLSSGGGDGGGMMINNSAGEIVLRMSDWTSHLTPVQASVLIFSALSSVGGTLLQYQGQRLIPAASAQPIYALSPLLGSMWACLVLHESISSSEVYGGLGITAAALLAATAQGGEVGEESRGAS